MRRERKVKDYFRALPPSGARDSALDGVAMKIFATKSGSGYLQSTSNPNANHGIRIDFNKVNVRNPKVANFEKLGPNEQYVVNKVLATRPPGAIYLVGGVGVGKTSFLSYFEKDVLGNIKSKGGVQPLLIHIDCEKLVDPVFFGDDVTSISVAMVTFLREELESAIRATATFTPDEELFGVWAELIEENGRAAPSARNHGITVLHNRLQRESLYPAEKFKGRDEELIERRRAIRDELLQDPAYSLMYLAALLGHIKRRTFEKDPELVIVCIDNLDMHTPLVQQVLRRCVVPLEHHSTARLVIAARPRTDAQIFHRVKADGQMTLDRVPYAGATPLEVIEWRLAAFRDDPHAFLSQIAPESRSQIIEMVTSVFERLKRSHVRRLFTALCGTSVRKGLLLAQRLVNNGIYGASDGASAPPRDLLRALFCGCNGTFESSENGAIDNVYQCRERPRGTNLLKLRALRAVLSANTVVLGDLVDHLTDCGFDLQAIHTGINELVNPYKALMWSDAFTHLRDIEALTLTYSSNLFVSDVGSSYARDVAVSLDYVQEVMADTYVDFDLGTNWDYGSTVDRLGLVGEFVEWIFREERSQVLQALESHSRSMDLMGEHMICREITESVSSSVERIVEAREDRGADPSVFYDFERRLGELRSDIVDFEQEVFCM